MIFHWSLTDSKSPQVSRTLLSIQAALSNAEVWMVSTCPLISEASSPITNPFGIIPSAPTTIGITVTFMFHSFFSSLERSRYVFLSTHSFNFTLWSAGVAKSTIRPLLLFLLTITRSGHLAEIRCSFCTSKSLRSLSISFSMTDICLRIYHLFVWSNLNFLHNYYYYYSLEFFTSASADGLSLEIE